VLLDDLDDLYRAHRHTGDHRLDELGLIDEGANGAGERLCILGADPGRSGDQPVIAARRRAPFLVFAHAAASSRRLSISELRRYIYIGRVLTSPGFLERQGCRRANSSIARPVAKPGAT
jgi:hypothetical protein